jgi:hypothetical protein
LEINYQNGKDLIGVAVLRDSMTGVKFNGQFGDCKKVWANCWHKDSKEEKSMGHSLKIQ